MTKALSYVEVDLEYCALRYGETTGDGTCPAVLGVDSDIKCFNSVKTCPVRESFLSDPVTLRFSADSAHYPADIDAIPSVTGISYTPATISLGKDLGQRASVSITFKDHRWPDTGPGFDKYLEDRPYNPYEQGTFWGKFRARHPYLRGRALRLIRGELGQSLEEMETRHYVIDSFDHDIATGKFTITAKDVLKLASGDRAQAPKLSQGFLVSGISSSDTTATLSPSGIGNAEYPSVGYLVIAGKEIVSFLRDPYAGNDSNTELLLHFGGADASTTFTDSSPDGRSPTANGNAQVDTAQAKFGTGSLLCDGTGDYASLADSDSWNFSSDKTVDCWIRLNALSGTQTVFSHSTDANNQYRLTVTSAGALNFDVLSSSSAIVQATSANGLVTTGQWYHVAVVRYGDVYTIYLDGVAVATTTDASAVPNFTSTFRVGIGGGAVNGFNGWIDEFRFSTGARWIANFDPPEAPYDNSSDKLTIVRAQLGTTAIAHDAQDRVQVMLRYSVEDAADIIRDLLVNYAGVPDEYIPLSQWQDETGSFLNRVFTADIAEPTPVEDLVSELIEDAALSLWWDDIGQALRLRVLRAIPTDAAVFDSGNILAGTLSTREQPTLRVSQIWRYFAKRSALEGQTDPNNYRSVATSLDLQAETDYGSSAIHKIYSRWIPFGGRSIADRANSLYLSRFRDPPRRFNLNTFRIGETPVAGQGYRVAGMGLQDDTGAATSAPIQITRLKPGDAEFEIEAEEMLVAAVDEEDLGNRVIVIDINSYNLNLRTLHDALYPAPTEEDVANYVNLTCIVDAGVSIGSTSTSLPAFNVGDWPEGFPIEIVNHGRIEGRGGRGGGMNGNAGSGGVAIYTRADVSIDNTDGKIYGGGGGGEWRIETSGSTQRAAGGGGAGLDPGLKGTSGSGIEQRAAEDGTPDEGGVGARLWNGFLGDDSNTWSGSSGGDPGEPGGTLTGSTAPSSPGAAGAAVDGISYVTWVDDGDVLGPQVN